MSSECLYRSDAILVMDLWLNSVIPRARYSSVRIWTVIYKNGIRVGQLFSKNEFLLGLIVYTYTTPSLIYSENIRYRNASIDEKTNLLRSSWFVLVHILRRVYDTNVCHCASLDLSPSCISAFVFSWNKISFQSLWNW